MKRYRTQWNQTQRVLALVLAMLLAMIMPLSTAEEFSLEGEAPLEEKTPELGQLDFDTTVKGEGQTGDEDCPEIDLSGAVNEASVEADAGLSLTDETTNDQNHPLVGKWKMVESRNKKGDVHPFYIIVRSVDNKGNVKLDWGANKKQTGKWDEERQTLTVFKNRRYLLKDGVLGGSNGTYSGIALKMDDARMDDTAKPVGTWEMTERRKTSKKNDVITYKISIVSVKGKKVRVSWGGSGVIDGTWNSKTKTLKVFKDQVYVFRWGMLAGGNKNYSGVAFRISDAFGQVISPKILPDPKFRKWVAENIDKDDDDVLTVAERDVVREIDVSDQGIANLKGIELFINLTELWCGNNRLTKLDVSKNTKLQLLFCGDNQLPELNVSKNTSLQSLFCESNQLKKLDVSNNSLLGSLYVAHNQIETIDIQNCLNLQEVLATMEEHVEDGVVQWGQQDEDGDWICFLSIDDYTNLVADGRVIYPRTEPTYIGFEEKILTVSLGDVFTLEPVLYPDDAVASLYWFSSDENVADVDDYGNVEATGVGFAEITVFTDNDLFASCTIVVVDTSNPVTYRALLVGQVGEGEMRLEHTVTELENMQEMFNSVVGPEGSFYSVTPKRDISEDELLSAVKTAFADADNNDVSLFWFSGHGVSDLEASDSFAGALAMFPDGLLELYKLANALNDVPGKVIVLIDSCGSGAAIYSEDDVENTSGGSFTSAVLRAFSAADTGILVDAMGEAFMKDVSNTGEFRIENKFYVLTASRHKENAGSPGFTDFLTEGVGTYTDDLPADTNDDGFISLNELFQFIDDIAKELQYDQHVQVYPRNCDYKLFRR